jgi:hypothetical protein
VSPCISVVRRTTESDAGRVNSIFNRGQTFSPSQHLFF